MLKESQYSSSNKYEARIYLNKKFKTASKSKYEWIFEHFPQKENLKILELGCGTGLFWLANRKSIRQSWEIILSDYSDGMLETTKKSLSRLPCNFKYKIVDAENIQFAENTFDVVLANNMLYHLQNRETAIQNVYKILKNDGLFIASTMGKNDLFELHHILYNFLETKGENYRFREYAFSLDNGKEQLSTCFDNVEKENYENSLIINEVEPIIHYYVSFNGIYDNVSVLDERYIHDFRDYLDKIMQKEKTIKVTREEGIFICKKVSIPMIGKSH